jgi:hypothetical protein
MAHLRSFWGVLRARYEAWQHIRLFTHWRDELDHRRGC